MDRNDDAFMLALRLDIHNVAADWSKSAALDGADQRRAIGQLDFDVTSVGTGDEPALHPPSASTRATQIRSFSVMPPASCVLNDTPQRL